MISKQITKCLLAFLAGFCLFSNAYANRHNDYGSNFYEDEGKMNFKVKVGGLMLKSKQADLPAPSSTVGISTPADTDQFFSNGFDVQGSTTMFFHDRFGIEFSVGLQQFRVNDTTIKNVGINYSDNTQHGDPYNVYGIPISATIQFHIAPFAGIRPYVGAGGYFNYMFSKSSEFGISNTQGLVAQLGVDFVSKDDTMVGLEVKKYFLGTMNVKYKSPLVNTNPEIKSSVKVDPIVVSLTVGFKF